MEIDLSFHITAIILVLDFKVIDLTIHHDLSGLNEALLIALCHNGVFNVVIARSELQLLVKVLCVDCRILRWNDAGRAVILCFFMGLLIALCIVS